MHIGNDENRKAKQIYLLDSNWNFGFGMVCEIISIISLNELKILWAFDYLSIAHWISDVINN